MAGGIPLIGSVSYLGSVTNPAGAVTIPAGASANTKGAWVTLVSSTPDDVDVISFSCTSNYDGGTLNQGSIDFGIGPAGSEVVVIHDILVGQGGNTNKDALFCVPFHAPAGSRIAVRGQDTGAVSAGTVNISYFFGNFLHSTSSAGVDAVGFLPASTTGTILTAPSAVNTPGAWSQLTSASSSDYVGFYLSLDTANTWGGDTLRYNCMIDVAIGPSGSEQIIVSGLVVALNNTMGNFFPNYLGPFALPIPAGSRISARYTYSSTNGDCALILYGMRQ